MSYHKYTRETLEAIVRESWSFSEVLVKLGLRLSGGGHSHLKRRVASYGIDTSHFLGRRANSGNRHRGGPRRTPVEELLTLRERQAPIVGAHRLRRALLEIGRPNVCELCGLGPRWNDRPLVLEVDHVNGLHYDYRPENLRFVCPNCHSQALNFAVRNRADAEVAER